MDLLALSPGTNVAQGYAALKRVLGSPLFCKAPRLSRLLRFLVEKKLSDALDDITEYGIGISVFDRDSRSYSTGEDPIVRVQIGRLRGKLQIYYAEHGQHDDVIISIPIGNYIPVLGRVAADLEPPATMRALMIHPFKDLSGDVTIGPFVLGLGEELSCHLFSELGGGIVVHDVSGPDRTTSGHVPGRSMAPGASHMLEGSLRADGTLMRTSVRLIEASTSAIVWSAQLDRHGMPGIAMQKDLASAICVALKSHFPGGGAGPFARSSLCHRTPSFGCGGTA